MKTMCYEGLSIGKIPLPLWEGLGEGKVEKSVNTGCQEIKE